MTAFPSRLTACLLVFLAGLLAACSAAPFGTPSPSLTATHPPTAIPSPTLAPTQTATPVLIPWPTGGWQTSPPEQ